MTKLTEQKLYNAFETLSKPVVTRTDLSACPGGGQSDPYSEFHNACSVLKVVETLPAEQQAVVCAKYGKSFTLLNTLITERLGVTEQAAEGFCLAWLKLPDRPRVWQLADLLGKSEITTKRKTKVLYTWLDNLVWAALETLRGKFCDTDFVENVR